MKAFNDEETRGDHRTTRSGALPPDTPVIRRALGERMVWPIGLGGASWSLGAVRDDEAAVAVIHAALDAGVDLIDTARAYTTLDEPSHNEALIARALQTHPRGGEAVVATKGGHYRAGERDFPIDGRPATLREHVEHSLRTLGVERLDLYFLHHPDPAVPIAESVGQLGQLRAEGKLALVGVSNVSAEQYRDALAETRIDAVENQLSVFDREHLGLAVELAAAGVPLLAYSPLGGRGAMDSHDTTALDAVAARHATSRQAVAIAWLLAAAPTVIPIVGARRTRSIADSATAPLAVELSNAELTELTGLAGGE